MFDILEDIVVVFVEYIHCFGFKLCLMWTFSSIILYIPQYLCVFMCICVYFQYISMSTPPPRPLTSSCASKPNILRYRHMFYEGLWQVSLELKEDEKDSQGAKCQRGCPKCCFQYFSDNQLLCQQTAFTAI